ncbi:MAG: ATP synthase F1 subunit gamma [Bacteroidales bacterium]|nr:ATP synthase F1 subunit gamma [Bacteroidales bacterium]
MANLKDIRIRINSVRTTRQVTSAMKMVSAAKFKKAQYEVEYVRPFVGKLLQMVNFLGNSIDSIQQRFAGFRISQKGKVLVVPIASNKGLAGAFNSNVNKEAERLLRTDLAADFAAGNVDFLPVGKQVSKYLIAQKYNVVANCNDLLDNLTTVGIAQAADLLMQKFLHEGYRQIILIYNKFVNAAVQNVTTEQLLPLEVKPVDTEVKGRFLDFIIEPNRDEVLEALVPQAVNAKFQAAMKESAASEHGARMTSMHKATDNATELLGELQLQYNKARQGAITGELIEIVSGAEALNN